MNDTYCEIIHAVLLVPVPCFSKFCVKKKLASYEKLISIKFKYFIMQDVKWLKGFQGIYKIEPVQKYSDISIFHGA